MTRVTRNDAFDSRVMALLLTVALLLACGRYGPPVRTADRPAPAPAAPVEAVSPEGASGAAAATENPDEEEEKQG